MPKTSVQDLVLLQEAVEVLMSLESTALEEPYASIVVRIEGANILWLAIVPLVTNGFLFAANQFGSQSFSSKNSYVVSPSWKRARHPKQTIVNKRNSQLVIKAGFIVLVRLVRRVLTPFWMRWLVDPAMDAIH